MSGARRLVVDSSQRSTLHRYPAPHDHDFDESYYVLSGSLWLMVSGQEVVLGTGEFTHIPGRTVHSFKGTSNAATQILIQQAPSDIDEFFRAWDNYFIGFQEWIGMG